MEFRGAAGGHFEMIVAAVAAALDHVGCLLVGACVNSSYHSIDDNCELLKVKVRVTKG